MYMYDSILYSPSKTITTLLIGHNPIQNKKLIKNKDDILSAGLTQPLNVEKNVHCLISYLGCSLLVCKMN